MHELEKIINEYNLGDIISKYKMKMLSIKLQEALIKEIPEEIQSLVLGYLNELINVPESIVFIRSEYLNDNFTINYRTSTNETFIEARSISKPEEFKYYSDKRQLGYIGRGKERIIYVDNAFIEKTKEYIIKDGVNRTLNESINTLNKKQK